MKKTLLVFLFFIEIFTFSQKTKDRVQVVDVSCGQCQFEMDGKKGCDLAVMIKGKPYFVEGTKIDDHGDAHSQDGFCNTIRKAEVSGKIKKGKFVATYFKLLPVENRKE